MKRALAVAVSGAAILIGGLVGCGDDDSISDQVNEATESARTAIDEATDTARTAIDEATDTARTAIDDAMNGPRVTIDGQDQNIEGNVTCNAMGSDIQFAIGDATAGIAAMLSEGDQPVVRSVALGNVDGVALGYVEGAPGGEATATKDGDTYTITGTATGADVANPMEMVTKPFEIKVTCPQ